MLSASGFGGCSFGWFFCGPIGGRLDGGWFWWGFTACFCFDEQAFAGVHDPFATACGGFFDSAGEFADGAAAHLAAAGHEVDPVVHVEIEAFEDGKQMHRDRALLLALGRQRLGPCRRARCGRWRPPGRGSCPIPSGRSRFVQGSPAKDEPAACFLLPNGLPAIAQAVHRANAACGGVDFCVVGHRE